jgi:hypothetical protein
MDSYDSHGFGIWYNLPNGNGSWSMYPFAGLFPAVTSLTKANR